MEDAFACGYCTARAMSATHYRGPSRNAGACFLQAAVRCEFSAKEREREAVFVAAHFMDRQDVGMIEACGRLRLAEEARDCTMEIHVKPSTRLQQRYGGNGVGARAGDHTRSAPARIPSRLSYFPRCQLVS
jgi:hypothetical protein